MTSELQADANSFNEDQVPDELPADFTDFDDEPPDELPAGFADFDEDRVSGASASKAPQAPMPGSSTVPPERFGSFQLLESLPPEERKLIMAFTQPLNATVTHVIPQAMPDPVFPRNAAHDWDTWRGQRDDRIFLRAREAMGAKSIYEQEQGVEEEKKREQERRRERLVRLRQIGHGWAKYVYWLERSPYEAQAYRHQREDERGEWLVEIAANRSFKARPKIIRPDKVKIRKPRPSPRPRGMGS
jgi:hypothetical protein